MSRDLHADLPLGKHTSYPDQYDPAQLVPIPRALSREVIGLGNDGSEGVSSDLPFQGQDLWTAWELSWLNLKGKPEVACAVFGFAVDSAAMVESKSFKLYLNSFNQSRFADAEAVRSCLLKDLTEVSGTAVSVQIYRAEQWLDLRPELRPELELDQLAEASYQCLDELDIEVSDYQPDAKLLQTNSANQGLQQYCSHLLRSLCPVTQQPDWASVYIRCEGEGVDAESLLRYIISFRENDEFHEQCVERMYCDLQQRFGFSSLAVCARYLRRGGLDINPLRASDEAALLAMQALGPRPRQ